MMRQQQKTSNDSLLDNRYEVVESIGRGGFGEVFRAVDTQTGKTVALKKISKNQMRDRGLDVQRVVKEVEIHRPLIHPNVIRLFDAFDDDNSVYIVTEYCEYGDMEQYLNKHGPLAESIASNVFSQVVYGVSYLHTNNVIHRDLSTSNILISRLDGEYLDVKIGDLGLATTQQYSTQTHHTMCGTAPFMPPEVAMRQSHNHKADIWSLGALLYALLSGRKPFGEANGNVSEVLQRIISGQRNQLPGQFGVEAEDLIGRCMQHNQHKRATLQEVKRHRFITMYSRRAGLRAGSNDFSSRQSRLVSTATADSGRGSMRSLDQSTERLPVAARTAPSTSRRVFASREASPASRGIPAGPTEPTSAAGTAVRSEYMMNNNNVYNNNNNHNNNHNNNNNTHNNNHNNNCLHSQYNADTKCCKRCGHARSTACNRSMQRRSQCRSTTDRNAATTTSTTRVVSSTGESLARIRTDRLAAQVERLKVAVMRITDTGDVSAEFLSGSSANKINDVMIVTNNGKSIVTYKPTSSQRELNMAQVCAPDVATMDKFSLESLVDSNDKQTRKKYRYMSRYIELLRAKLPKVTMHTSRPYRGTGILREQGAFEFRFVDGRLASRNDDGAFSVTSDTTKSLTDDDVELCEKMYAECRRREHILEACNTDDDSLFPVIFGCRPRNVPNLNNSGTPRLDADRQPRAVLRSLQQRSNSTEPRPSTFSSQYSTVDHNSPILPISTLRQPVGNGNNENYNSNNSRTRNNNNINNNINNINNNNIDVTDTRPARSRNVNNENYNPRSNTYDGGVVENKPSPVESYANGDRMVRRVGQQQHQQQQQQQLSMHTAREISSRSHNHGSSSHRVNSFQERSQYLPQFDCSVKTCTDGIQMRFGADEKLLLKRSGQLEHCTPDGQIFSYDLRQGHSIPDNIRERLQQLQSIDVTRAVAGGHSSTSRSRR